MHALEHSDQGHEHDHDLKKQNASNNPAFRNLPIHFTCPHCDYSGYTIVEQKTTYISYVLMVLVIFLFGILPSIFLLPLIILLTRNYSHRCPSCFKEVGSDHKILSILNLTDKVISFNVGEFGIVLSRRIILGVLLTLVVILTIYAKLDDHGHHHDGPIVEIKETWNNYIEECGRKVLFEDDTDKTRDQCRAKYAGKTILWQGYVIRVEDYRRSIYSFMHHAVVILVKMVPTESESYPDIFLAIDSERAYEMGDLIVSLDRGSEITFNATIINVAEETKTSHLHLLELKKGEGKIEVPMHIHEAGRYEDKPKFLRHVLPDSLEKSSNDDKKNNQKDSQDDNQNDNQKDNPTS